MVSDRQGVQGDAGGLYGVLGVAPGASQEAVVHAYRRQARAVHPDVRPDDPTAAARFRILAGAYEVLSDPVRRAHYDRAWQARSAFTASTQPPGYRPSQERLDWTDVQRVVTNGPEVLLDRSVQRPRRSHLWVGPVRVEASPGEPFSDVRWPGMPSGRELGELASLVLRILTDRWPE